MTILELRDKIYNVLLPLAGSESEKPLTEIYKYPPKDWANPPFMIIQYAKTDNETEDSCSNNLTFNFNLSIIHIINSHMSYGEAEKAICNIIDQSVQLLNDNRKRDGEAIAVTGPSAELLEIPLSDKGAALSGMISIGIKVQDVLD